VAHPLTLTISPFGGEGGHRGGGEPQLIASLRYDLSKLRAKGLIAKLPNSRRYQLLPQGYSICLVFL